MDIADIVERMQEKAALFRGVGGRVKFALDGGGVIMLDATQNPVHIAQEDGEAECTIRMSAENMAKLIEGKLNPMLAFTMGKLKVDGSKGLAMKLASVLDE